MQPLFRLYLNFYKITIRFILTFSYSFFHCLALFFWAITIITKHFVQWYFILFHTFIAVVLLKSFGAVHVFWMLHIILDPNISFIACEQKSALKLSTNRDLAIPQNKQNPLIMKMRFSQTNNFCKSFCLLLLFRDSEITK